jgi:menaquinone-dependent protoporphyrinogen IX oxidase
MTALIVYTSYNGTTEKVAYKIKENLECQSIIINAAFNEVDSWRYYDRIVICFPVHADKPHKEMAKFIKANINELAEKEVFLVVSCLDDKWLDEKLDKNVPQKLLTAIKDKRIVGGILDKSKLSHSEIKAVETLEKKLNKDFTKVNTIDDNSVISLAKLVSQQ